VRRQRGRAAGAWCPTPRSGRTSEQRPGWVGFVIAGRTSAAASAFV
jgi:hypothetical protein